MTKSDKWYWWKGKSSFIFCNMWIKCKFISEGTAENWGVYCMPQLIAKLANICIYHGQSFQGV